MMFMSQKAISVILMSSVIAISIVTMTNRIGIAVAQYNPSTGQPTSTLSPPSTPSPPLSEVQGNEQSTEDPNSSTTSSPAGEPVVVGPSHFTSSPITR